MPRNIPVTPWSTERRSCTNVDALTVRVYFGFLSCFSPYSPDAFCWCVSVHVNRDPVTSQNEYEHHDWVSTASFMNTTQHHGVVVVSSNRCFVRSEGNLGPRCSIWNKHDDQNCTKTSELRRMVIFGCF